MQEMFSDWMDHKEVIPASYQEYNDKFEETDEEERDEEEAVEEDEESMTTTSDPVYTPLLPDEGEGVDVQQGEDGVHHHGL